MDAGRVRSVLRHAACLSLLAALSGVACGGSVASFQLFSSAEQMGCRDATKGAYGARIVSSSSASDWIATCDDGHGSFHCTGRPETGVVCNPIDSSVSAGDTESASGTPEAPPSLGALTPASDPAAAARIRASAEFGCPASKIRLDLLFSQADGKPTYRVHACGHEAKYTCGGEFCQGCTYCVREPNDGP